MSVPASGTYTINPSDYLLFAASGNTITALSGGSLTMSDGATTLSLANGVALLQGIFPTTVAVQSATASFSGTISANGAILAIGTMGPYCGIIFEVSGTFVGTLTVTATNGLTYQLVSVLSLGNPGGGAQPTITGPGLYYAPVAYTSLLLTMSGYASGTASCVATLHTMAPQLISPDNVTATFGGISQPTYMTDSIKSSYSAAVTGLVGPTLTTDLFTISGSASKIIRVTRLALTASQTTAAQRDVLLIKRSAANTGGTSSTATGVAMDSTNSAATAVVRAYTANPTALGAAVGTIRSRKVFIAGTAANSDEMIQDFGIRGTQAVVLRSAAESLCVNLNGVTSNGNSFDLSVEWTEE